MSAPDIDDVRKSLLSLKFPGGTLSIARYESAILDDAARAPRSPTPHPIWSVVASLRAIGVSVDELCAAALKRDTDTLLFGKCVLRQCRPLHMGRQYRVTAELGEVSSRIARSGDRLDSFEVRVGIAEPEGGVLGAVDSTYLIKRSRQ